MIATIANSFSVPEIRRKILFTAAILALYRLGAYIPVPGINFEAVENVDDQFSGSQHPRLPEPVLGRRARSDLAIFSLGIMPYITASIILQLMTVAVPSLEKLQKEGEVGQQKITQYTRYLTVALAAAQSIGYVYLFRTIGAPAGRERRRHAHLRQAVPDRGHADRRDHAADVDGRADHPARHRQRDLAADLRLDRRQPAERISAWWTNPDQVFVVMMPFIALAVILGIVFIQEGQRRIPVQYAKRVVGRQDDQPAARPTCRCG